MAGWLSKEAGRASPTQRRRRGMGDADESMRDILRTASVIGQWAAT
jgi:hypothetical protein